MSQNPVPFCPESTLLNNNFKDPVCIDAYCVYDSCADKDCVEDVPCYFQPCAQSIIESANAVKIRNVSVECVSIDLSPVGFQAGFYTVDMTFYFSVKLDAYSPCTKEVNTICGLCTFDKKAILYGSEGNVKIYSSDCRIDDPGLQNAPVQNLPRATVQVADPVALSAKLCEVNDCNIAYSQNIPDCICNRFGGNDFVCGNTEKRVLVTIGLFTITQIERNVQILVPSYDFGYPEKGGITLTDDPCQIFDQIDFPTKEFFPKKNLDYSALPIANPEDPCQEKCCNNDCCKDRCKNKCCKENCSCRKKH